MTTCPQCGGPKAPSRYYCSRRCSGIATGRRGSDANHVAAIRRTAAIAEDVEFMLSYGESAHAIASRLDTTVSALSRRLYRAGRRDLARAFSGPTERGKQHPCPDCGALCWKARCYRCGMAARDTWRGGPSPKAAA